MTLLTAHICIKMHLSTLITLCFFALCLANEDDVMELSDLDFDIRIADYETALVMFYAPWCEHCNRLKPEYAKAAEDLIRNNPPVALATVDCTEPGKETCDKIGVSGFPTLKIYRNGQVSENYNGPREADGFVKYMKAQIGESSKELKNLSDLNQFLATEKRNSLIGFFEKESDLKTAFFKTADKLRTKVTFAYSSFEDVLGKYGAKDNVIMFRPVHLHNKFEENTIPYKGKSDDADINIFITSNFHGLVGHRTSDDSHEFENPLVIAYYSIDYEKNPKGTNYWRNRILSVAKKFFGKMNFAVSNIDDFQEELHEFGLENVKSDTPTIVARNAKNQKFILKDDFSIQSLEQFVNDILEARLEPYLKSEPIAQSNSKSVKVAVAKNFDELVVNNGKDTLIEFYAPWCGHCKKLAPIYDELADKLKDEDVVLVKMDATANDVAAPFEIIGYPTLYWAPRDSKDSPVRYEEEREVDDLLKYIAEHATNELKGYDRNGNRKPDKIEL